MIINNPTTILFDINGNVVGVSGSMALPTGAIGQLQAAYNARTGLVEYLSSSGGAMLVTTSNPLGVTASATLPVQGVVGGVPIQIWSEGNVGVSASVQLPVFSTGPVGVSSSAAIPVFVTGSVGVTNLYTGLPSPLAPLTAPANIQDTIGWSVSLTGSLSASNGQITPLKSDFQGNVAMREQFAPVAEDNFNGVFATALLPTTASIYTPTFSGSLNIMPGGGTPTVIKGSPGVMYRVWATNRSSGSVYLQLFNSTTTPAAGAVPLFSWIVVPTSVSGTQTCASEPIVDFAPWGAFFSTGIAASFSSTPGTYTAAANYGVAATAPFDSAFMWK